MFGSIPLIIVGAVGLHHLIFRARIINGYDRLEGGVGRLKANSIGMLMKALPAMMAYAILYSVAVARECVEINGKVYMRTDYSIECDDEHSAKQTLAIMIIFGYCIVALASFLGLRWFLQQPHEDRKDGVMWSVALATALEQYEEKRWYWRFVEFLRREYLLLLSAF